MKLLPLGLALLVASGTALADDGQRLERSVSSAPGVSFVVEPEGEHAYMSFLNFYVPAQLANGELTEIEYYNIDDVLVKTETEAKPLVNVYLFGPAITYDDITDENFNFSEAGFPGHGRRDAYGAVSLDDGETWKKTNLSNSGDKSSFTIPEPGIPDPAAPTTSLLTDCAVDDTFCLTAAEWIENAGPTGRMTVDGFSDTSQDQIEIVNGVTKEHLFYIRSKADGTITTTQPRFVSDDMAPCSVQAVYGDEASNIIDVANAPLTCVGDYIVTNYITAYPGDVTGIFHGHAGNRILVAWQSKFCSAGFPAFSAEYPSDEVALYLGITNDLDLYLVDMFGVGGSQGSHDYTEDEEYPGEYADIGTVPFSCLWSARGQLREDPENPGTTEMVWFQAERLTSGRRDVNRIETSCWPGAGCAVSWQEDPEGLRPGEGEGAGTGWAGATTHSKTDIWYSFIEWEDFDIVNDNGEPLPLADNILDTGRPMPYVPMMMPVRLTNNDRCNVPVTGLEETYCNEGFAGIYGIKDQCVGQISIPLGPNDELTPICVVDANDDGVMDFGDLPNVANTAASRPRLSVQPRDSDGDGITDDAWIIIIHEEDKGLGQFGFRNDIAWDGNIDNTGEACGDPDADKEDNCIEADIGKNVWYISFAMGTPQTSVLDGQYAPYLDYSLLSNIVAQQNQWNAPEVNWITGTYYPPNSTEDMWDFGELNFVIFNNEIARRASLMAQPLAKAINGESHLIAMPLFKEGIINQGGPADIMARRVSLEDVNSNTGKWRVPNPDNPSGTILVDETEANPYDFSNIKCETYDGEGGIVEGRMEFTDGSDPYYPKGLCLAATINLSGHTPYTCEPTGISDGTCPGAADMTCEDSAEFGQLCLSTTDPEDNQLLDKLLTWYQCPGWNGDSIGGTLSGNTGSLPAACYNEPDSQLLMTNLDDRSWYMPVDLSKAHRGFLDGDYVNMMYAWSPNWKLNAVGHDLYELYMRRSFDGGVTWTTTPSTFEASNGETYGGEGNTTCETWRDGDTFADNSHVCTVYEAGEPEQGRNVTQHVSILDTTLDPRYTPDGGSPPIAMSDECPAWYQIDGSCISEWLLFTPDIDDSDGDEPTDLMNPSRSFVVFESGDNTTTVLAEAEPDDLDYGRAEIFGDVYTVWTEIDTDYSTIDDCYPNNAHDDDRVVDWGLVGTGFCNEFDSLEGHQDDKSEEASLTASAYGDFLYAVWGQYTVDPETNEDIESDDIFRRIWYIDDYISTENAYTLPGTQQQGTPDPNQ